MWNKSDYDWMLFLSPMTFTGIRTYDFVFTRQALQPLDLSNP